jgi:hypothetical protein
VIKIQGNTRSVVSAYPRKSDFLLGALVSDADVVCAAFGFPEAYALQLSGVRCDFEYYHFVYFPCYVEQVYDTF